MREQTNSSMEIYFFGKKSQPSYKTEYSVFSFLKHYLLSYQFSVFTSHDMKSKNRNPSMNKVKNPGYDK